MKIDMTKLLCYLRITAKLAALCVVISVCAKAQTAAKANSGSDSASKEMTQAAVSDVVSLNPFEVQADSSNSYNTLNSNSITRFNVELDKMPLSADIFDQAFMDDVGATGIESMIQSYSAGAGFSGNDPGSTASASTGDHTGHANMQLRGFTVPYMMRDSLMPVGSFFNPGSTGSNYTSNFDIERAEVIEGPQSLLYSSGGGGGVINVVSKQARFGQPATGSLKFQLDQYGSKQEQFDYGFGTKNFAIRVAAIQSNMDTRRVNLSGSLEGYYVQAAVKVPGNTTIRITGEQTTFNQLLGTNPTLSAASTTADSRNGQYLSYLLATNQTGANTVNAAGVANASGAIDNGYLNWSNVNSYGGWQDDNLTRNTFVLGEADTKWNDWLSTQVSAGYNDFYYDLSTPSVSFYAPTNASNPNQGSWTVGMTPGDLVEPGRAKAVRFVALATNNFLNGKAKSQTIVGGDFLRQDAAQLQYAYVQADSNFNPIISPTVTTLGGRTLMAKQYFTINNGIVPYTFFGPRSPQVSLGGVNYVRQLENIVNPALVTAANPMGTIGTSGTYELAKAFNKGWFAVNNTQWFDGKLDTLLGLRFANFFTQTQTASTADSLRPHTHNIDFDVGLDYALVNGFRVYVSGSNTYYPPEQKGNTPLGQPTQTSSATSEEAGLKWSSPDGRFSGSLSVYHDSGKNEQYSASSTIEYDINPSGLNGLTGTSPSNFVYVNRKAQGVNLTLTANPTPNWRMRLSAADVGGTVETSTSFNQVYNDQFHENSSGQVTYADGTLVYVPATYNSKAPTVTSTTAGAVPLTVSMMNSPSSVYYANPINPSGAISPSSAVFTVLKTVDPVHGSITTGVNGLPISSIQITPSFTVPGVINVTQAGDKTVGFPQLSANFTNIYTISTGAFKGVELGGTLAGQWKYAEYYYYPLGVTNSIQRSLYSLPGGGRFDLIVGYTHKFRRVTFATQLNIFNMTNHYSIIVLPSETNGWATLTSLQARYSQNPRSYTWSSAIKF